MSIIAHQLPTVGILPGWSAYTGDTPDRYLRTVFKGIQALARKRECNLLLAWSTGHISGSTNARSVWPLIGSETDFVPVGPWNTNGLIVFAPLRNEAHSQYIQQVIKDGHPVLFIASGEEGPTISADNEIGIRQAVAHLADHGHRSIAFLAGDPVDSGDSLFRLRAYWSAVEEFSLNNDPKLVKYGGHDPRRSCIAMKEMLASGIKFTALIASNDNSAIGAMQAIKKAGLHIPRDIAIIGFDDQPDAIAQVPPLASVHVPLAEIGYQALNHMLDHLEYNFPLTLIKVPTWLVVRQSCGCFLDTMLSATKRSTDYGPAQISEASGERSHLTKELMVKAMVAAVSRDEIDSRIEHWHNLCNNLVESFFASIEKSDPTQFLLNLMELLQDVEQANEDVHTWQEIVAILRRNAMHIAQQWTPAQVQFAEEILHLSRTAISESARRADYRHRYQADITAYRLGLLTSRLSASLDEHQAVSILEQHLPEFGIHPCKIMQFEADAEDPVAWSAPIGFSNHSAPRRFPTRQFPPPGSYPTNETLNLALLPLVFQDEPLGYMAFDATNLEAGVAIAQQLAATFKVARLHQRVVELSLTDSLTGLYNRRYLDHFIVNEVERCRRYKREMAFLMIDLDNFKEYNDIYGHPAGDEALRQISICLTRNCRKTDIVMRYGGDEFAIVLPETDIQSALEIANRIWATVANLSDLKRTITLSLGISMLQGAKYQVGMLIKQADQALYEAKHRGGNQVCQYQKRRQPA